MPRRDRPWLLLAASAFVLVLVVGPIRADLIFLKDGTILQGQVKREEKVDIDPATGEPFRIASGFFLVDDGPRRMYFPQSKVVKVVAQKEMQAEERIAFPREFVVPARSVPPIHQVLETSPWDDKWDRKIRIRSLTSGVLVNQHLALLTPHFAKVDAITHYAWADYYLTRELGPEMVQGLLATNPKYQDDPKLKDEERAARRFRVCDFYAQAGWFDLAERGLDKLAADFPAQKEQVDASRAALGKARAREFFELIKRLQVAGRYETVKKMLADFPIKEASEVTAADFRTWKASFDEAADKHADTRRLLDEVAADLKDAPAGLAEALAIVRAELHPDRSPRLEAFLGQALQAARQRKAGRTPESSAAALASLAVTGWFLGAPSAEPRPDAAVKLWRTRQFVLDYLHADGAATREKMIAAFDKKKDDYARLDEICQLIPQLPPEAPETTVTPNEMELKAGEGRRGPLYLVKLPPEYSHNRQYPVLLALPPTGEQARYTLRRFEDLCAENGYILVVPRWEESTGADYGFSEREHQVALDVLRDVRRRFQVDSDRVFLSGLGFGGGDMAFDVGLSHPDLFAGVIPVSAGPSYFSDAYWRNGQYLPFYVINGDRSGDGNRKVREQFNNWVPRGYGMLWVQYKGRGAEWFAGEMPAVFDWMRAKHRATPLHQLGTDGNGTNFGNEFYTMRQSDNRFYWLTTDSVQDGCCNSFDRWSNRVLPAKLTARIDPSSNDIYVRATGVKQVTVWLGRNGKGESMVDFDKPLTVRVNLAARWSNRKVAPSLETLLNDLVERGDRQRLFLAKIELGL